MKSKTTKSGLNRNLGQFFSPKILVDKAASLIKYKSGRLLEPSCGNGAFRKLMDETSVFIEIDKEVIFDDRVLNMDFFDYPISEKFDTIIGNPPYIDNKLLNITHSTAIKVQANLYLYFIEKCFYHLKERGELKEKPRIYVNCKTRNVNPFFLSSCHKWDGSILALFPKISLDLEKAVKALNSIDWNALDFATGRRYIFGQKSLQEALIDKNIFD